MRKNVTVCPYDQAQQEGWAPGGGVFDWAWRVERPNDSTVTGVCNGKRSEAEDKANTAAIQMATHTKPSRIKNHKGGRTKASHPFAQPIKK